MPLISDWTSSEFLISSETKTVAVIRVNKRDPSLSLPRI